MDFSIRQLPHARGAIESDPRGNHSESKLKTNSSRAKLSKNRKDSISNDNPRLSQGMIKPTRLDPLT